MRPWSLVTAVVLNTLGLAVPLMGYTAWFLILAWCAFIAVVVAMVSPRWNWLVGTAASPWFLTPWLVWNAFTASPDYVAVYGHVPWRYVGLAVVCGCIGATLGAILRWLRGPHPTAKNAVPGTSPVSDDG
jgi:hypothetical protein